MARTANEVQQGYQYELPNSKLLYHSIVTSSVTRTFYETLVLAGGTFAPISRLLIPGDGQISTGYGIRLLSSILQGCGIPNYEWVKITLNCERKTQKSKALSRCHPGVTRSGSRQKFMTSLKAVRRIEMADIFLHTLSPEHIWPLLL